MAGLFKGEIEGLEGRRTGLQRHQLKAAAAPGIPLSELAKEAAAPQSSGNFKDLESLLEQLGALPVFELGNPLPERNSCRSRVSATATRRTIARC